MSEKQSSSRKAWSFAEVIRESDLAPIVPETVLTTVLAIFFRVLSVVTPHPRILDFSFLDSCYS